MASQIAHIVYAQKYLEKFPLPNGGNDLFILGATFPDIRRIAENLTRKETHLCYDCLDLDFKKLTPFQAGWKFHLYCDMKREVVLNNHAFYSLENTTDFWNLSAKMLEDEVLYGKIKNWEKLTNFFNSVPFIETGLNVSRETFELWYAMVAKYIEKRPCDHTISAFLSKQPSLSNKTKDIIASVDKLRKNAKVIELLSKIPEEII